MQLSFLGTWVQIPHSPSKRDGKKYHPVFSFLYSIILVLIPFLFLFLFRLQTMQQLEF